MPLLSVIVPIYKKEAFLASCVDSILASSLSDLELILVDDGSPDRCGEICDAYAAADARVSVIHQENRGVSAARNAGLSVATGAYVAFVDADDRISPDMYQTMLARAKAEAADIVTCGITVFAEDGRVLRKLLLTEGLYSSAQMLKELFQLPDQLGGTCCNKIFLRSAVAEERFPEDIRMCEDRIYLFGCYCRCAKNVKISEPLSYVVESADSATRQNSVNPLFEVLSSGRRMNRLARAHPGKLEGCAMNRYLDDCVRYLTLIKKTARKTGEHCFWRFFKNYMHALGCAVRCAVRGILPPAVIHGYLNGLCGLLRPGSASAKRR